MLTWYRDWLNASHDAIAAWMRAQNCNQADKNIDHNAGWPSTRFDRPRRKNNERGQCERFTLHSWGFQRMGAVCRNRMQRVALCCHVLSPRLLSTGEGGQNDNQEGTKTSSIATHLSTLKYYGTEGASILQHSQSHWPSFCGMPTSFSSIVII